VGCQPQRWDANRSGGIPTTLCDLCVLQVISLCSATVYSKNSVFYAVGCQPQRCDANRSGGIPTTLCDLCVLQVISLCYATVYSKNSVFYAVVCQPQRWDANRSGGIPTTLCVFVFLKLWVCAKQQCTARIVLNTSCMRWYANRSGGFPTTWYCSAGYGVHSMFNCQYAQRWMGR